MSLVNFDNVKAAEIQPLIDNIWKEPATSKSYAPKANTLKSILEGQTAQLQLLEDPEKLNDVSVKWVDFCGDTSSDGTYDDDCNNTVGGEGTAMKKSYQLDIFITDKFSVASEELEQSVVSYDTIVATGLAAKLKNIVENLNKKAVAVIAANKGINPYPGQFTFDVTTKDTTIPAAQYGGKNIIPYLMQVSEMNKSRSIYTLDGGSLFQDYYTGLRTVVDADGKSLNNMYNDVDFHHDMSGFATNSLSAYTFLIDDGALAIANRAKWPSLQKLAGMKDGGWIHTNNGNFMRYSIPINLPDLLPMMFVQQETLVKQQLLVDVQYSVICEGTKLVPTWFLKLRAAVLVNPIRCNVGNTGIISLKKGA